MLPAKLLTSVFLAASAVCHAQMVTQHTVEIQPASTDSPVANVTSKPKPLARGQITGHVICNDTHQPARGAMVMLQPMPDAKKGEQEPESRAGGMLSARVALDGSYTVQHVPRGDYAVLAFYPGYLSAMDDIILTDNDQMMDKTMRERMASSGTTHVGADGTARYDVTLERGATITGRVLYADGSPASQVNIELENTAAPSKVKPGELSMNLGALMRSMFTHQTSGTDDQGRFRISGIHPGTYRVAAVEPLNLSDEALGGGDGVAMEMMGGMLGGMSDSSAQRLYAGDTIHRKAAKTYELRAGDTVADLDIRLPIDGYRSVRVKLSAPDGRAITRATVRMVDTADDALIFSAVSHLDGIFEFRAVPPGTYNITVSKASIGERYGPTVAAFADGASSVIVKESDGAEVALSLKEVPLPAPGKDEVPD